MTSIWWFVQLTSLQEVNDNLYIFNVKFLLYAYNKQAYMFIAAGSLSNSFSE